MSPIVTESVQNMEQVFNKDTDANKEIFKNYEVLTDPDKQRFSAFPIEYPRIYEMYKKQKAAIWHESEIDFSSDYRDFEKLTKDEQHVIKMILAFFAGSDGIVNMNITGRLLNEITLQEARMTYTFQAMMEDIHNITYSMMLDNLIKDKAEKQILFNAFETIPCIKKISDWALNWISSEKSLGHRIIAYACVEGILFSGAFATIFWLKFHKSKGNIFMPGFIKSNEFIARDEGMHYEFGCELFLMLKNKPSKEEIKQIIMEAVDIAIEFAIETIQCKFVGMNSDMMTGYIQYIADRLFMTVANDKIYNVENPCTYMNTIGMTQKTNFFESRPTEYQSAYVMNESNKLHLVDDF